MKKYKKQQLQEFFKEVLNFRNHKIYDVEHSLARYKQRVGMNLFNYIKLLKKGINWIINNNLEVVNDRYIFISKKYGFGIQVHWGKDKINNIYNGYSATTFSNNEMNFFTKADKEIFLENSRNNYPKNYLLHEADINFGCYYSYEFNGELKKEVDLINMNMFIESGNVFYTYKFIEL